MIDPTRYTLGLLLGSKDPIIQRNATSILKTLQRHKCEPEGSTNRCRICWQWLPPETYDDTDSQTPVHL